MRSGLGHPQHLVDLEGLAALTFDVAAVDADDAGVGVNPDPALGQDTDSMQVEVTIGVPMPDRVDTAQVAAVLPHGTGTVNVVEGGLQIPNDAGTDSTLIAHAAAVVRLELD